MRDVRARQTPRVQTHQSVKSRSAKCAANARRMRRPRPASPCDFNRTMATLVRRFWQTGCFNMPPPTRLPHHCRAPNYRNGGAAVAYSNQERRCSRERTPRQRGCAVRHGRAPQTNACTPRVCECMQPPAFTAKQSCCLIDCENAEVCWLARPAMGATLQPYCRQQTSGMTLPCGMRHTRAPFRMPTPEPQACNRPRAYPTLSRG